MALKSYCTHLQNKPTRLKQRLEPGSYSCAITGNMCIAAEYYDPDPGNPLSLGSTAEYNDDVARETCPAYNAPVDLVKQLVLSRLEFQKSQLEKKILSLK